MRIQILGGGLFQIPIIQRAKQLGFFVLVTDMYPNPPGKKFADLFIQEDIKNFDKNLKIAQRNKIEGIVCDQTDAGIQTAAWIAEKMNLVGIGYDTAKYFTNKYLMRSSLADSDIPHPKYMLVKTIEEALLFVQKNGYPVVLKPLKNQSSRGVYRVTNNNELIKKFPDSMRESDPENILIEEFIEGIEYTVESFVYGKKIFPLAISDKLHYADQPCVAKRLTYPPKTEPVIIERLKICNEAIIKKLKLPFGITHAEFKVMNGIPYLIEIAARGGGTYISSLITPEVSGFHVTDYLLEILAGKKNLTFPEVQYNAANLEFLEFPEGRVENITGLDEARKLPGVKVIHLDFKIGSIIESPNDDRSRPAFIIVTGKTRDEVLEISEKVKKIITVTINCKGKK